MGQLATKKLAPTELSGQPEDNRYIADDHLKEHLLLREVTQSRPAPAPPTPGLLSAAALEQDSFDPFSDTFETTPTGSFDLVAIRQASLLKKVAEKVNFETGQHLTRMAQVSVLLAEQAGMNNKQTNLLSYAAALHDLGKIALPEKILLKPGELTPIERMVINKHVEYGVSIIGRPSSELLSMAKTIIQCHHEKLDGSGYPNGLAGDQIPLVGRIAAVADVFDALVTERPYKAAWSMSRALNYLSQHKNTHFDQAIIDIFFSVLPEIQKIYYNNQAQE